ncbi:hypothetical protein [Arthrobacter sp. efr-133-TYG-104]|uniref:hypothetical protein n=1 Tax=Arthrobacter sp. efr-133-TYG-104 TaxID=3040324 RepID=UPI00254B0891|nr:hypothetical protein [Arthrobacter sp. efr-133-TYG-104]
MGALLFVFGAAAGLGIASIFRAKCAACRGDAAAVTALALVMVAVGLGWVATAAAPLALLLGAVFAWFAGRTIFRKGGREGSGRFSAAYSAAVTALSGWVVFSAWRGGGSASDHPAHQLGIILCDLAGVALMVFAAAGWLLSAFAMPAESKSTAVPRLTGVREALIAAGIALAFYAVS